MASTKFAGSIAGRYATPGSRRAGTRSAATGAGLADETDGGGALDGRGLDAAVTAGERSSAPETAGLGLGVVETHPAVANARTTTVIVETLSGRDDRIGAITATSARAGSHPTVLERRHHVVSLGSDSAGGPAARESPERVRRRRDARG